MAEKEESKADVFKRECPLAKWPGAIELPDPYDFDGLMWRDWRKFVDETEAQELNRLYAYAGAKFIQKYGAWTIQGVTLAAFQKWEYVPKDEKVMLASWVGKQVNDYMKLITDPKG